MQQFCSCIGLVLALLLAGCDQRVVTGPAAGAEEPAAKRTFHKIRPAAVAGLFYPADKEVLGRTVDRLLAQAKTVPLKNVRALVCPHAGYEFSGHTAAAGYKQLFGRAVRTAVVLGPSHYADFRGAAVADADAYATPLGPMGIAELAAELLEDRPFVLESPCWVERPGWAARSSREPPPAGQDGPHTWEHSVEVEVPFLQRVAPRAEIVPVVVREVDAAEAAQALAKHVGAGTILVASSDLSHFHPYEAAKRLDRECVQAICDLDVAKMPVRGVRKGAHPGVVARGQTEALEGHAAGGVQQRRYVGRAVERGRLCGGSFHGTEEGPDLKEEVSAETSSVPSTSPRYTPGQRNSCSNWLARRSVRRPPSTRPPTSNRRTWRAPLASRRQCFVTLTKDHELRGCIGNIFPREPLYQGVIHMAQNAAAEDPRFPPVKPEELERLKIGISVLTVPRELLFDSPADLVQKAPAERGWRGAHGGPRQATFLPQVWEQLPDKRSSSHTFPRRLDLLPPRGKARRPRS